MNHRFNYLNDIFQSANKTLPSQLIPIESLSKEKNMLEIDSNQRLLAAIHIFIECLENDTHTDIKIDKLLFDYYISIIDDLLSEQVDSILHHPDFQELESTWRGLRYLIDHTDFNEDVIIDILNIPKDELFEDMTNSTSLNQTILYKQLYENEYDTPGGEPTVAMIGAYDFSRHISDIELLHHIGKIAELTHCPFIGNANSDFFNKPSFSDMRDIDDLSDYFEQTEYIQWNAFREKEYARYVGLTLPRFLLRMPYGDHQPIRYFVYEENVAGQHDAHLWGHASFAFAANMTKSFAQYGWAVNIRGPQGGGKVSDLILPPYDSGFDYFYKIPTEIIISESKELTLSELGFIPLCYYKNSNIACFFSANSCHQPQTYLDDHATASARINARLPYILLCSRIAHYLKVLQREYIGSNKTQTELEYELNTWLKTLVTKMNDPDPELLATHPLRDAKVNVLTRQDNPGFYQVNLEIVPHFKIEGIDVKLSLISELPNNT